MTRILLDLDDSHNDFIGLYMQYKKIKNKSDAIRDLISTFNENYRDDILTNMRNKKNGHT